MGLTERAKQQTGPSHVTLLAKVRSRLTGVDLEEFEECLVDPNISAAALSRALDEEYGIKVQAARIREWRVAIHGTQGQGK